MKMTLCTIYNAWQRVVFTRCDQPFKYRRDFSTFEKRYPNKYASLIRLESIMISLGVQKIDEYFLAPYEICDDYKGKILPLDFFVKPRAIRMYKNYRSVLAGPDEKMKTDDAEMKQVDESEFL